MSKNNKSQESPLLNLVINIVIPSVILLKFSGEEYLGPVKGLIVALAFPVGYGAYEFIKVKKWNIFSILGFVSILLTGVLGLLAADAQWIAIKEAAVPFIIGLAVLISMKTSYPLVRKLLFNEQILNVDKINENLYQKGNIKRFEQKLNRSSYLLAGSFFFSAFLNYGLAEYLLVSQPGTASFNEELGQMTALSFPVIALPSTIIMLLILWYLIKNIKTLSGLEFKELFAFEETQ